MENYQGNAVINYTDAEIPFTRIIEHKHFEGSESEKTIITKEYPKTWSKGEETYYPMNDKKNTDLFEKYKKLAEKKIMLSLVEDLECISTLICGRSLMKL